MEGREHRARDRVGVGRGLRAGGLVERKEAAEPGISWLPATGPFPPRVLTSPPGRRKEDVRQEQVHGPRAETAPQSLPTPLPGHRPEP